MSSFPLIKAITTDSFRNEKLGGVSDTAAWNPRPFVILVPSRLVVGIRLPYTLQNSVRVTSLFPPKASYYLLFHEITSLDSGNQPIHALYRTSPNS